MTEGIIHYLPLLDWYSAMGAGTLLSDEPRNYYQTSDQPLSLIVQKTTHNQPQQKPLPPKLVEPSFSPPLKQQEPKQQGYVPVKKTLQKNDLGDTHPARACQTLVELRQAMETATGCDLIKAATTTVFSGGNPKADIMFIGEAPGAEEDRTGEPFVGQSGQLLDAILATIGLDRTMIYITNIIPWRPPGNRPPTTSEIAYCLPFIERHIALVRPKIIILLGGVATKTLLRRDDGILKLRGELLSYTPLHKDDAGDAAILAMPTFHPSYIMRSPSQKSCVWKDMLTLKDIRTRDFTKSS